MKKILLFAAAALMLLACAKEDQVSAVKSSRQDGKIAKFYASTEGTAKNADKKNTADTKTLNTFFIKPFLSAKDV